MDIRLLGPLEVHDDAGSKVDLAGGKPRALLVLLSLQPGEAVPSGRLMEDLWPGKTPRSALQVNVSRLRKALGNDVVRSQSPGYVLDLPPEAIDTSRFERLLEEGRLVLAQGDAARAAATLRDALALWRGPALADVRYETFAQAAIGRLEGLRFVCLEERIEADLALGRDAELVPELEALVAAEPLREGFRAQLMLALYRSGRQAEALAVYQEARRLLLEELGLEPGPGLRQLHQSILRQDAQLVAPAAEQAKAPPPAEPPPAREAPPPGHARDVRKTVTVLFADLAGSTALGERLDPEAWRRIQSRYFKATRAALERHGGTVEKFIGDAVMAVFGLPAVHEDDPLRAVRAALEMRQEVAALRLGLSLELRIGLNTGEVVAGLGEVPVAGDVVNVAARLEQASSPGEIHLGELTYRLVRDAVRAEPVEPLTLRSKGKPVPVWRLLELLPDAPALARRLDAPLVGRSDELAQLSGAFARAGRERTPYLFTVLGVAGIGKTRLARELMAALAGEAQVLLGRCLSYGEGITFWPLREIVREAAGEDTLDAVAALFEGERDAAAVADALAGALGHTEASSAGEEVFWAARRLFETLARRKPLLVVLEDLHWAEPRLLDLVEYLADSVDAPVLVLCLARPELLDDRKTWAGGKPNATTITLEPLAERQADELLASLAHEAGLPAGARARAAHVAEGNPLFLEQAVSMLAEGGSATGDLQLPPTIEALLTMRLERLEPGERFVLACAAVVGKEFTRDLLVELLPEEERTVLDRRLEALVRKQFVRPEPTHGREGAFQFRHVLVQNASYRSLTKELRASLHELVAGRLEEQAAGRLTEVEEIVGYHLEQAFRARAALGLLDEETPALARKASERLASAGERAHRRGDAPAAVNLLERAVSLLPDDDPARLELLTDLSRALFDAGEFRQAEVMLAESIGRARVAGDRRIEWNAIVLRSAFRMFTAPERINLEALAQEAKQAISIFEELGDHLGLARAWNVVMSVEWDLGRMTKAIEALKRMALHAHRAGKGFREEAWAVANALQAALEGPIPAAEGLRSCEESLRQARGDPWLESVVTCHLASNEALLGRFADARAHMEQSKAVLREYGLKQSEGVIFYLSARNATIAGDPATAEQELRFAIEILRDNGDFEYLAHALVDLARAVYAQGRYEEAHRLAEAFDKTPSVDLRWQVLTRAVRARLLALEGRSAKAEALAREAVAIVAATEYLTCHADVVMDLAEVLLGRDPVGAAAAAAEALELYERKGNVASAARVQSFLADLADSERAKLSALL